MMTEVESAKWQQIIQMMNENDLPKLAGYIDSLSSREMIYVIGRLEKPDQIRLFSMLSPEDAAGILEEIADAQTMGILENMDKGEAAAIISELPSDHQADIILELEKKEAEAILTEMDPEEAVNVRKLIEYDPETAGGLMLTEYLSYPETMTVGEVVNDLRRNVEKYSHYHVRYIYVTDIAGKYLGVLQMQDLLMNDSPVKLNQIMVTETLSVNVHASLVEVVNYFDTYDYFALPVVDDKGLLVGVLRRKNVLEAEQERTAMEHLETQGIVGGDELRSMPVFLRSKRRLSWLSVNIFLNIIAASVIAFYQDTLSAVIALAVFLPIISDMSGCTGNQAVAVSMRELSLGVVKPSETFRVWLQEISVGLINGLVLGILIGAAAWLWKGNVYLGLVVGGALALNTLVAVSIGGTVPLILKKRNIDPALASGPILTTITDMIGFFMALAFATVMISKLGG
ncbi:MAG: magnesium transporter [bacterium]|jgi:magnesium transporter